MSAFLNDLEDAMSPRNPVAEPERRKGMQRIWLWVLNGPDLQRRKERWLKQVDRQIARGIARQIVVAPSDGTAYRPFRAIMSDDEYLRYMAHTQHRGEQ